MKYTHLMGAPQQIPTRVLASILLLSAVALPQGGLPENGADLPALITVGGRTGSCFMVSDTSREYCYIVSARHVFFKDTAAHDLRGSTAGISGYTHGSKYDLSVDLEALFNDGLLKADTSHDIAVARIGRFIIDSSGPRLITERRYIQANKGSVGYPVRAGWSLLRGYDHAVVGNDVFIFGYPKSLGLGQSPLIEYDRPLIHKGIVAGKNPTKRTLVLDAAVYPGNSGGPVVEVERASGADGFVVVGIVTDYVPFIDLWYDVTRDYTNTTVSTSSYSIVEPLDPVLDIIRNWRTTPKTR